MTRVEQRMARTDEGGQRLALRRDQRLLEGDALVARQHRLADADQAVAVADRRRDVGDLVAARLALLGRCRPGAGRLRGRTTRCSAAGGGGPRRAPCPRGCGATRLASIASCASARSSSRSWSWPRSSAWSTTVGEAGAHLGLVAVADRLDQQVAQRPALELELAEHVEDLAAERLARLLQLLQQRAIDIALARLVGDQVPQVADLGLADAVDAAEALLEAVRVPRQVVVDHQVGALEVDALAGGVGGEQDLHLGVVLERLLRLQPLLAAHAAVDHDDRLRAAEQRA